jgi:hypothetical protein
VIVVPDAVDLSDSPPPAVAPSANSNSPDAAPKARTLGTLAGRTAVVIIVLVIAVMWIYAYFGHFDVPGRLPDQAFPTAAQPVCQAALDKIHQLPTANLSKTASDRADVVDQGSTDLEAMLADLRTKVPAAEPIHGEVSQWLDDWTTYVHDRRDYTAALRKDPTTRFAVTQSDRDKSQITNAVDNFATVNDMPACATPDDLS